MHPALQQNLFLVKEHVGFFKAANNFDVYDPATGEVILECREPHLGMFTKMLRFTDYKRMTPFDIRVTTPEGEDVLSIRRGVSFWLSKVSVFDEEDDRVGGFKQKFFSIGGAFQVLGADDQPLCDLKGKWTAWDYKFENNGVELARVTRKWSGLGKELFTSADNYVLSINDNVPPENPVRILIMAAVFCIDMVLKE
ncbi:Scramblase [Caulifigura coniformis]|uniref:Scramblase n=1 Tax=Caulifigura coniformis TaxID=2527983 RepID=A0A517SB57_9PLAN|nr:phospholipid scramblase-related protein [Caulifigura coniformis]QDT53355.1 Scramblase [Caulifigura coniformis]